MQMQITEQSPRKKRNTEILECPMCRGLEIHYLLAAPDRFHGRDKLYALVQCRSCFLVWLKNPPQPYEMDLHYSSDYDRAIASNGEDPRHWWDRRETLLKYKSAGSVLDLGCSAGGFLRSLKGASWELHGIEMSEVAAARARSSTGADIFVGDILEAPFRPSSFDAITCFHVFEHLYYPREVLMRVSRWLKPGGIFFTMMPNIDSAGAKIFKSYWYALELPRHLYHFSPVSFSNIARSVGLREVSLTTARELFIEHSTRYILDDLYRRIGIPRVPLAKMGRQNITHRAIRKAIRLTLFPILNRLASIAGDGESIHAVFKKV